MRTLSLLALSLLLSGGAIAEAGHRHGRGCGHHFDRHARKWVSVNVFGPGGGFAFGYRSAPRYHYHGRKRCRRPHRGHYDSYYDDRGWRGRGRRGRGHGWRDRDHYCERRYGKRRYHKRHRHHHYGRFCPF